MCLDLTSRLIPVKIDRNNRIECYKRLLYEDGKLYSPLYAFIDENKCWEMNKVRVSDRGHLGLKNGEIAYSSIEKGLHVYLNEEDTHTYEKGIVRVKMIGEVKNLVAVGLFCGRHSAVFTELFFPEQPIIVM